MTDARALYAGGSVIATPATARLALRVAPRSSRVLVRLRASTELGSPSRLAVVGQGGGWLAVISSRLGNGVVGYVRRRDVRISHDRYALEVDLSARRLTVWEQGRRAAVVPVGIGRPESPTPIGRFSVTDELRRYLPSVYGCCILALSAHQERRPAGSRGGDRIAIHGGRDVGGVVSAGCLHASEDALRYLVARVPLGTQVVIHP